MRLDVIFVGIYYNLLHKVRQGIEARKAARWKCDSAS